MVILRVVALALFGSDAVAKAKANVLGVDVNRTTGAYRITLNGETFLRSGQLLFHANDEWHGTAEQTARQPTCGAARTGTDQTGGTMMQRIDHSPDDASCCAACIAKAGCNSWVRGPPQTAPQDPPACFLISGARGTKPRSNRTVGFISSPPPGKLTLGVIKPAVQGRDRFGVFMAQSVQWHASATSGATASFNTNFRVYEGGQAIVLEQSIPAGATGTAYRNVTLNDSGMTLIEPFLHFPSFRVDAGADADASSSANASASVQDTGQDDTFSRGAGWTTWQGTQISRGFLPAGKGPPPPQVLGLDSGPVVVLEPEAMGGTAVIVAPTTHFKGAVQVRSNHGAGAQDWVAGVSGEVRSVPAGFKHETMLFAGAGVTDAVLSWGSLMQRAHNTTEIKVDDLVTEKVGYWTDNGAYYYGDAYPQARPGTNYNLSCCSKSKLLAARDGLAADGLPMAYMQLDDWWYTGPHPTAGIHGVKCVDEWVLPEDTYPGGLDALRRDYGSPFLLYGPYFCTKNQWNQSLVPKGGDAGVPFGRTESEAFYKTVFEYARKHGAFAFEVDFMNELYLSIPEFRSTLDAATEWQLGMNAAAAATDLRIQFCMMHPSDLLSTLQYSHVTNGRSSPDYASGTNWFIGHSSLLFEAVGLRPSKDNFWSGDGQARQPGFHESNPGSNGELNAILATMSTGPVGPADGAGQHNATRLRRTCTSDGHILGTARPLTPVDALYQSMIGGSSREIHAAALWTANSHPRDSPEDLSWHVLGVDVNSSSSGMDVLRTDLYPPPRVAQLLAVRDFHRSGACIEGADAVESKCVRLSRSDGNAPLLTMDAGMIWPSGTHSLQLYTVRPVAQGSWALLGELSKFVPISAVRFSDVRASSTRVSATLAGAVDEVVEITALRPAESSSTAAWTVATQKVKIGQDGKAHFCLPATAC